MKRVVYNNVVRGRKIGEFVKALSQCTADRDARKSLQKSLTEIKP